MPKTSSSADSGAGSPCPHTPGPWQVLPPGKAQSPWIVADIEGGSIADCEPPGPWMPDHVADANARLIAAAPQAIEVVYAVRSLTPPDSPLHKLASAVIAKVEGTDAH